LCQTVSALFADDFKVLSRFAFELFNRAADSFYFYAGIEAQTAIGDFVAAALFPARVGDWLGLGRDLRGSLSIGLETVEQRLTWVVFE